MFRKFASAGAILLALTALALAANAPTYFNPAGIPQDAQGVVLIDTTGQPYNASAGGGGGDATAANQVTTNTEIGGVTETAPATDIASSGLNGRLQRIAQRLSTMIAAHPAALGGTTAAASFPVVLSSDGPFATQTGSVTETAPATDTASSGLNGRLQRIAQRVTSLIALMPTALGAGGGLKVDGSGTALPVSGTVSANPAAATSGGATPYSLIAAASTNSTLISAGAHQLYGIQVFNNSSTIAYLKLYDKATPPTCNSDTPVLRFMVPGNAGGSGFVVPVSVGAVFTLGLGLCLTGGIADNDNTSVAATTYLITGFYK
jgi:hypothetical protein